MNPNYKLPLYWGFLVVSFPHPIRCDWKLVGIGCISFCECSRGMSVVGIGLRLSLIALILAMFASLLRAYCRLPMIFDSILTSCGRITYESCYLNAFPHTNSKFVSLQLIRPPATRLSCIHLWFRTLGSMRKPVKLLAISTSLQYDRSKCDYSLKLRLHIVRVFSGHYHYFSNFKWA